MFHTNPNAKLQTEQTWDKTYSHERDLINFKGHIVTNNANLNRVKAVPV